MTRQKRIKNQELLDFVKTLPCICCLQVPSDPDHITTRGAGGDDSAINVWPLCREHHTERHAKGILHMTRKYNACMTWLIEAGRTDVIERIERHG